MPAKKGSKKLVEKHSLLGIFQKNKKTISDMQWKLDTQTENIHDLEVLYSANQAATNDRNRKIDSQRNVLFYKRKKLKNMHAISVIAQSPDSSFSVSTAKSKKLLMNPTSSELNQKAKITRFNETLQACNVINGSTAINLEPSINGLLGTLTSKFKSKELSSRILTCLS